MKLRHIFLALFISLSFVGCKNDKEATEKQIEAPKNAFKVAIKIVVKQTANFCLLYTEDGSIDFKDGVWKEVIGSPNEQTVEFVLPEDVFPTQFRLDLGQNPAQEDIVLKTLTFDYLGNTRVLEGPQIGVFFRPDTSKCTYDASTGIIQSIKIDGVKQFPSLYPHETIQAAELPKLAK
ncbi:hypothetical protein ACI6PS_14040 [Flavobacterium sp. PLA-1-15]|uniref:hypothetical protein n=1 Tax=Flavobacterium sp. PLA-1-15 TaxID=3380533 RepID=UPI003B7AA51C